MEAGICISGSGGAWGCTRTLPQAASSQAVPWICTHHTIDRDALNCVTGPSPRCTITDRRAFAGRNSEWLDCATYSGVGAPDPAATVGQLVCAPVAPQPLVDRSFTCTED